MRSPCPSTSYTAVPSPKVFPTDSATDGECVLIACQLPVGHALYNGQAQPFVDPLLVLEAAR